MTKNSLHISIDRYNRSYYGYEKRIDCQRNSVTLPHEFFFLASNFFSFSPKGDVQ